jgi:uncharacterized protein YndB with AHSA1/START domain
MSRSVAASAVIDAPIELVWRVITDVASYGEWSPFVVRVEGEPQVGAKLRLHVRWSKGGGATVGAQVTRFDPPNAFDYREVGPLDRLGLVRALRVQTLEERDGKTHYETREEFRGPLRALLPLADVQDGFERHAQALKQRAEALAHP